MHFSRLSPELCPNPTGLCAPASRLYRDLVENASDLIYVIDLQGNSHPSTGAQRISGYTRSEALRMNIAQ